MLTRTGGLSHPSIYRLRKSVLFSVETLPLQRQANVAFQPPIEQRGYLTVALHIYGWVVATGNVEMLPLRDPGQYKYTSFL